MAKRKQVALRIKKTVYADNSYVIDSSIPIKYYWNSQGKFEGISIFVDGLNSEERYLVNKLSEILKLRG
jgi:hypothetical protein